MGAPASSSNDAQIVAINITPFVDVVLVLLIIFMATAGHINSPAIEVDLPQAASEAEAVESTLSLVLAHDGTLYLDGKPSTEDQVSARCRQASEKNPNVQAVIAADARSQHEQVIHLIDLVKLAGVESFALGIDKAEPRSARM